MLGGAGSSRAAWEYLEVLQEELNRARRNCVELRAAGQVWEMIEGAGRSRQQLGRAERSIAELGEIREELEGAGLSWEEARSS